MSWLSELAIYDRRGGWTEKGSSAQTEPKFVSLIIDANSTCNLAPSHIYEPAVVHVRERSSKRATMRAHEHTSTYA